jgi:murein DD-endopeptidase MepM/ murein hydrolase activator NlpD
MRLAVVLLLAVSIAASACAARALSTSAPRRPAEEIAREPVGSSPLASEAPAEDAAEPTDGVVHVVQPGQTLWRIARAYDVALDRLADANGIEDPARVDVGTPIFVPGARATLDVAAYPAPLPFPHPTRAIGPTPSADFLWPVDGGAFMRPYGEPRRDHTHAGVDIRGTLGQDIVAAKDGVVAFGGCTKTGYGTMVVLDHGDGVQTLYAHAKSILVRQGDAVRRGQPIARLGRTGNATTEHCHFELRLENHAVDPMPYLLRTTEAHR